MQDVTKLKSSIDLSRYIQNDINRKPESSNGHEDKFLCPFHHDTEPSFVVSNDKQVWYCFGCGEGGDVLTYIQKRNRTDFLGAVDILSNGSILHKPYEKKYIRKKERTYNTIAIKAATERAARYYHSKIFDQSEERYRFLDKDILSLLEIGYGGKFGKYYPEYLAGARECGILDKDGKDTFTDRIVFPIKDIAGNYIGLIGRGENPKYINTHNTSVYKKSEALYGVDIAYKSGMNYLIVVEGQFDVAWLHCAHRRNKNYIGEEMSVVALSGASMSNDQARIINGMNLDLVVLWLDNDGAGVKGTRKAINKINHDVKIASSSLTYPDPCEAAMSGADWGELLHPYDWAKIISETT